MVTTCFERDVMEQFVAGTLQADLADNVMRHLDECESCESVVEALESRSVAADSLIAELKHARSQLEDVSPEESDRVIQRIKAGLSTGGGPLDDTHDGLPSIQVPHRLRDYELLESLGDGGMGMVYRARHTRLDRIVALKLIRPDRLRSRVAKDRFDREMKAAGLLEHPNVVRALDAGDVADQHFLAMEYVNGETLTDLVNREGPLPVSQCCQIIAQAASGLQHIYESGLVHRDIKPSNLMWCPPPEDSDSAGQVKILDLGLALLSTDASDSGLTSQDQVMGTYDYIAPEQARRSHDVDIRADIYSLGCTFYFLLTGQPPFPGASIAQKLVAHQLETPASVTEFRSDIPEEVVTIIDRMMDKSADDRFAAPTDVLAALREVDSSCAELPLTFGYRGNPRARRHDIVRKWLLSGMGILFVAMMVFAGRQIIVSSPQGDVIVEWAEGVSPDDVRIEIAGDDGIHIADSNNGWKITVDEGTYSAKLLGDTDELVLQPNRVLVTRKNTERLSVTIRTRPPEPNIQPVLPHERKVTEWVFSVGGRISCWGGRQRFFTSIDEVAADPLRLHTIDLANASWSSSDLDVLAKLPNLDQLILNQPNSKGDDSQESDNDSLTPENDSLTPEVVSRIRQIGSLRVLRLQNVQIDDQCLSAISQIENLRVLALSGIDGLSQEQLDGTRKAMSNCHVLCDIDETLTDTAADTLIAELPGVSLDRRVARWVLSLGGEVNIDHVTTQDIVDASRLPESEFKLTTIDLLGCRLKNEELLRLDGLMDLRKLILGSLWGPTDLTEHAPEVLVKCEIPQLQNVLFNHVPLTDDSVNAVSELSNVFELRIKGTNITDACFPALARLPALERLYLEQTHITGAGFTHLADHDIEALYLVEAPLTEDGFLSMPSWPNLTTLRVDGTPLTDKAIHAISRYPLLEDLGLNLLPNTTSQAWDVFQHLSELKQVRFRVNPQSVDDTLFARLAHCSKLERLDLELCNVTAGGLLALDRLPLKYLDLRGCRLITLSGLTELQKQMPDCHILSSIHGYERFTISPDADTSDEVQNRP
ncbi:MAG: serine/threonine protein kinase [Planctomycetaceae bacterium]|nr:serine/threonine protein kinase [Planctomycetaceae bacterium]